MNPTATAGLTLWTRVCLSALCAIEGLALALLPRGPLRKRTLRWVDRRFERIRRRQNH